AEEGLWEELAGRFSVRLGLTSEQCRALIALLAPYYEYFVAFPDSNATVRTLHDSGYQLALLTNAPLPSVDQTLRYAGMDPDYFAVRISRTHIGVAKPDPEAFLRVAALMGVTPEQCLAIDDQLSHVEAARQCGMQAWLLDRSAPGDDLSAGVVCSLDAFAQVLSLRKSPAMVPLA
ncbi:MAG: HAD-IA family hydrolase, partial [Oscillochloris sp.]|nr:HAD-IA family hydrolase [Oscillochloris sp.]